MRAHPPAILDLAVCPHRVLGPVRRLNGVNRGPIDRFWGLDLREQFRRLKIASVRLHDCPMTVLDVADLHHLFPDPQADPDDPANYHFEQTDDYLAAIRDCGAGIYFRLGESIEHQPHKRYNKAGRWDLRTLARVCVNTVRHYNAGWANGFAWDIRDWEIWNEPDLGPQCWGGSAEQFFDLYATVATALKSHDPSLRVGGASFSSPGAVGIPVRDFLTDCSRRAAPLDFLSWHRYCDDWQTARDAALAVRRLLDEHGFTATESHFTEWGYLPRLDDGATVFQCVRAKRYDDYATLLKQQHSAAGAAFIFGMLARLQDMPVEQAHFYTGDSSNWGLFETTGVPKQSCAGIEAFAAFLDDAQRIDARASDDVAVLATVLPDLRSVRIGLANRGEATGVRHWQGDNDLRPRSVRQFTADGWADLAVSSPLTLPADSITLIEAPLADRASAGPGCG